MLILDAAINGSLWTTVDGAAITPPKGPVVGNWEPKEVGRLPINQCPNTVQLSVHFGHLAFTQYLYHGQCGR
jgi:hypothetical protein